MTGLGYAPTAVMNLLDGLEGCYRIMVAVNFFTSISLAKRLLGHDMYLIGTLRRNRAGPGSKIVQKNSRYGDTVKFTGTRIKTA